MANVNVPTDKRVKEQDVNRKLQLYGIYSAFADGRVPSNKQIDVALNAALGSKALTSPSKRLSSEGQQLIGDLKEVIRQAKYLLLSKNQGNLLQEFIWDCQDIDAANAGVPNAPTDKATAQQHGNEALDGLKVLGRLMLSNGQFRKLLNDAAVLARDMAGDAASTAANKINPDEEQLKQIDKPAADDTWHDVPTSQDVKSQVSSTYNKNKPFSRDELKQEAQRGANTAQEHPSSSNREAGREGAQNAAQNLKAKAQQNIPDETQENIRKAKDTTVQNTKSYLSKKMPEERREQTIWRLKKMIVEIQGHEDYQDAINTLISLAETYGGHAKNLADQSGGTVKEAHGDGSLRSAEKNLRTLLERFANSTSADDIIDAINNIYRDADQDPELKNWFKQLDRFIRRSLQEQGYILKDSSTEEWNRIYDKGNYLLRERYRDHFDRVLDEFKFFGEQFDKDPQNKAFADATQKLFLDLGNDEDGNSQFKPWLIKDLAEVIVPAIFENIRYVPVPRIEVSDPMVDVIVENLVIESDNLFPNQFEFASDNYFRMGRKDKSSKIEQRVMIGATGIQMDLRDVSYYIKKKQGFPSISDLGVMDIILQGEGFSFKLAARTAQKKDRNHFIVIDKVDVTVHDLKINIKQSNHKLLFKLAKGIVLKVMKPAIQKVIEMQIRANVDKADAWLYGISKEAKKSMEAAKNDPENAQNIWQSWVNAIQTNLTQKKKKAEEKASDTTVNVAVTQEDSIFKKIALPGGISTKATEYRKLAQKGERWESPIFSWGDAKESTDIPKLAAIQRKPHSTAKGQLQNPGSYSDGPSYDSRQGAQGLTSSGGHGSGQGTQGLGSTGGYDSRSAGTSGGYGAGQTGGYESTGSGGGLATRAAPALGAAGAAGGVAGLASHHGAGSTGTQYGPGPGASGGQQGTGLTGGSGLGGQHGAGLTGGSGLGGQTGTTGGYGSSGGPTSQQQGLSTPAAGLERQMDQAFDPHHGSGRTGGAPTGGSGTGAGGSIYYDNVTR